MVKSLLLGKAVKGLLACALAGGVFWWVVEHNGPRDGRVTVHVLEPGVEVTLASQDYFFQEMTAESFVLRLPAGRYDFRVRRGDTVLHAETFTLRNGESRVLAAIHDERGVLAPRWPWPAKGAVKEETPSTP
jgi:hypothetical protein